MSSASVLRLRLAVAVASLSPLIATAADEAATAEAAETVSLFDGTLAGWAEASYGGQGLIETVPAGEVDGGSDRPVLQIGSGDPLTGIKWTGPVEGQDGDADVDAESADGSDLPTLPRTNYTLRWQARRTLGDDFFCSWLVPVGDDVCSLVVGGWGGGVIGLSSLDGMDAGENQTTAFHKFDDAVWYDFALTVTPTRLVFAINGEDQFEVDPSQHQVTTRVEMEPLAPLGIATYLSTGELRAIRLERLAAE